VSAEGRQRDPAARPAYSLLGCGCAAVVALILAVIVGLTWIGYRSGERYRAEMTDPAARRARVAALLPHQALPAGYHAVGGLSLPFMMKMAVIADREPGPAQAGDPGVRSGFLFVRTRDAWGRRKRLQKLFDDPNPDPKAFSQGEVGFTSKGEIGRGELKVGAATVHYYARRGELAVDQTRFGVQPVGDEKRDAVTRFDGVATMMLIDCPTDGQMRVGMWFAPEPAGGAAPGGPGDPAALAAFLGHFQLCS
jgi:hypothetical protein